jgi:branched-subunit amino acid permease
VIYAIDQLTNLGFISNILSYIPLYNKGFGWVVVCIIMVIVSIILHKVINKNNNNKDYDSETTILNNL